MNFSSKAKNLVELKKLNLKKSLIPTFYKYKVEDIIKNKNKISNLIIKKQEKKICIRSSYYLEDSKNKSMAGEFDGLSDLKNSKKNIILGINKLVKQYKSKTKSKFIINQSEIIFQNYVFNSKLSGVVTNFSIQDGSDYYVINYDDTSSLTNTVTSGSKTGGRVIHIFKKNIRGLRSKIFRKIIISVIEIEKKINNAKIDIEFAVDKKGIVNIFQIRPISTTKNWKNSEKKLFYKNLIKNQKNFIKINSMNKKFGKYSIFGLMPDWNPAEMIGYQPNNLAYSLYHELITKESWSIARKKMGYKNVDRPLMYKFTGKPFIDARLSFYSFLPSVVKNKTAKKIVNYWSNELISKPYLHDKIEFDISDGSYDAFTKSKVFKNYNFLNHKEKTDYLKKLQIFTNNKILNFDKDGFLLNKSLIKLENDRAFLIKNFKKKNFNKIKYEIENLILNLKKNGIIPFSIYARYAFIGKKFLNSLFEKKIISKISYIKLINSINSITTFYINLQKIRKTDKNKKIFDNYFYHLRPGTYDINIKRYNSSLKTRRIEKINELLSLELKIPRIEERDKKNINLFLKKNNFTLNYNQLIKFCLVSIKLRENSKFIFTRSLSDLLEILKYYLSHFKISKNKFSKLDLNNIFKLSKKNKNKIVNKIIMEDKKFELINRKSKLPYLITNFNDFFIASNLLTKPNFVTDKVITRKVIEIKNKNFNLNLSNKVILIENADPGFDWIFSNQIGGLVTKYGGINSHMSIMCEELNIPAVIGLGNDNFEKIKKNSVITINCKNKQLIMR